MAQTLLLLALATVAAAGVLMTLVFLPERPTPADEAAPTWAAPTSGLRERIYQPLEALTERVAWSRRRGRTLAEQLTLASLRLTPGEFVGAQVALAALLGLVGLVRFGFGIAFALLALCGFLAPAVYLRLRRLRRRQAFQEQIPEALAMLAGALRAGYSFPQALDSVARGSQPPLSEEFARAVREIGVGSPPPLALASLLRRVESDDMELAVVAITIHSSVGGNLARILDNITHTIRERVRVKGEIQSLTAQARASGFALTALPVAVGLVLYFIAPTYFTDMLHTVLGWVLLGYCAVSILIGNLIFRRIARIDVL